MLYISLICFLSDYGPEWPKYLGDDDDDDDNNNNNNNCNIK
jgi:hypothetical protein